MRPYPPKTTTVDEYVSLFITDIQQRLKEVRKIILDTLKTYPNFEESISYAMPAYKLNKKILVYFGGFKNHIGFYPTPSGIQALKDELKDFTSSKGAVQFPHNKPLPVKLIQKIVEYKIKEIL
jgi:uncharacterized protein YdhG (YjbR/CyaY superfamily)